MCLEETRMAAARKAASVSAAKSAKKPDTVKGSAAKALANTPTFTRDEDLHAYREMLLIRRFEEKSGQMYGMGLIGGFCHLYIGQEAVVIGMQMASIPAIRSSPAIEIMDTCWPAAWNRAACWRN